LIVNEKTDSAAILILKDDAENYQREHVLLLNQSIRFDNPLIKSGQILEDCGKE